MYPAKQVVSTHPHLPEQVKKDDKQSTNSGTEDSGFFSGQNLSETLYSYEETPSNIAQVASPFTAAPQHPLTLSKEEDSGLCTDIDQSRSINMNELCNKMGTLDVTRNVNQQPIYDDDIGNTVYHVLVDQCKLDDIERVIKFVGGYGLDIQNDFGRTALHEAVDTNQPSIVQCLLKYGADPAIRDYEGNTPLHIACINGATECAKEILNRLYFSSKPAQDIEEWNFNGKRCVHLAVESSNAEILKYLIKAGANINSRAGKAGYTPLHIAVETSNYKMVDFLLKEFPTLNIEQGTYAGLTAYQLAGLICDEYLLNKLHKRGAELLSPPLSDNEDDDDDSDEQIPSFYGSNALGNSFTRFPTVSAAS